MFCTNCGKEVNDGTTFCPYCGQGLVANQDAPAPEAVTEETVSEPTPESVPVSEPAPETVSEPAPVSGVPQGDDVKPGKKVNVGLVAIIAVVAIAVIVAAIFAWKFFDKKKRTFDVAEYIQVEFEGYDGYGTAVVSVDEDELGKKVGDILDVSSKKAIKSFKKEGEEDYDPTCSFYDVIEWEVDKTENLSNGDEIKVSIKVDEDAAEEIGIYIEDAEKTVKVEDLKPLVEVDPFEGIEVTFDGSYPYIYPEYENNGTGDFFENENLYIYYSFEDYDSLDEGDTVTLTIGVSEEEAMENGFKMTQTSKEYTVPKMDGYIRTIDGFAESTLEEIEKTAVETIQDYFDDYKDEITYSDLEYEGMYLISSTYSYSNSGYAVYSATVKSKEKKGFKATKVYFPISFYGAKELADGTQTIEDVDDYITGSYDTGLEFGWTEVKGFTDLKSMYDYLTEWYDDPDDYIISVSDSINPNVKNDSATSDSEEETTAVEEETTAEETETKED